MFKLSATSLCLSLSLTCLPLISNAATSAQSDAGMPSKAFTLSCTSGNFTGEIRGHYFNYGNNGRSVYVKQYKITRNNNQSGGNKANVNMTFANVAGSGSKEIKSSDSMQQDGNWHDLNAAYHAPWAATQVRVQFVFDKSGSDPKCEDRLGLG